MGNQIIQTDNVESEELHYIEAGWDHPSGDSGRYVPIGGIHSHIGSEKDPRTQNPTASNRDLLSFVGDDCQLFMLIELHGKLFLALKTNSTPRNLDPKTLQRRIGSLTEEFASSGSKVPIIDEDRLRFNQQIALEYGLSLYQSSDAEPDLLKRLPLFYS